MRAQEFIQHLNEAKEQGLREGTLNELQIDSGMGNDPMAYYAALISLSKTIRHDKESPAWKEEADEIQFVARAFAKQGMEGGRETFVRADTKELMTDYLQDRGFDVQADIIVPYREELASLQAADVVDRARWKTSLQYQNYLNKQVKISAIPDKPIDSWSKPGEPAAEVTFDMHPKRDIKAEFAEFKQTVEQRPSLQGVNLRYEITIGGRPVDINDLTENQQAKYKHQGRKK